MVVEKATYKAKNAGDEPDEKTETDQGLAQRLQLRKSSR